MIDIDIRRELQGSQGDLELNIALSIKEHQFLAIAGQSGSGKTTLLRIIAGLESASGNIKVHNSIWLSENQILPVQKREIGFVFQEYALFENMSVEKNLLYVKKNKQLATKLLKLTGLSELKDRLPNRLSGGQKQRVALCRAFMKKPKLILMDEPLSALDPTMRLKLQNDILKLHHEFKTTTIMVSHDPSEIYKLANRLIVLDNGLVAEDGEPKDILLKTKGSQKFSLGGEILEIIESDVIYIAIVAIGQQIVEVVLDEQEALNFRVGESIRVTSKAFNISLSKG